MQHLEPSLYMTCKVLNIVIDAAHTAIGIINIAIAVFGTMANGLVIMAYHRNPRLRNTRYLILAIADVCVIALVEPIYIAAIFNMSLGRGSCVFWDVYAVLSMLFVKFLLMTIVILSLQSYITLANNIITKSRLIKATVLIFLSSRLSRIVWCSLAQLLFNIRLACYYYFSNNYRNFYLVLDI